MKMKNKNRLKINKIMIYNNIITQEIKIKNL